MITSVGELAPAVKAAQTAQRRHMYGSGQACECGFVPIDMADWARHRMAEALEAALTVLAGTLPDPASGASGRAEDQPGPVRRPTTSTDPRDTPFEPNPGGDGSDEKAPTAPPSP